MNRFLGFLYSLVVYLFFIAVSFYSLGFLTNFMPHSIDTAPSGPHALLNNVALMALFALQHSLMARPFFKNQWTKIIPPLLERSTYVLFSSLALILLYAKWQSLPFVIWEIRHPYLIRLSHLLYWLGWVLVFWSTWVIDHFELFGVKQAYAYWKKQTYQPTGFVVKGLYRYVRHPILLGTLVAFWSAPVMTAGHLLLALLATVYVRIAIPLEEKNMSQAFGSSYLKYQKQVPMLIPFPIRMTKKSV